MKRVLVAVLLLGVAPAVNAQSPSQSVQSGCRTLADRSAQIIIDARRKGASSSALLQANTRESWVAGVQDYMVHAAERSPTMTTRELATRGYSYCISRRPAGK